MKIRISLINYSNTIPFSYGLLRSREMNNLSDFSYGYPAQVAQQLKNNISDISIISVGAIPDIPNAHTISKYCISASQRVDSVLLCSNTPLESVSKIILDYQSRTSNVLTRILAKESWNINPVFEIGSSGYELQNDSAAKVIIGDRALNYSSNFKYVYDLANEWYKVFYKPFVFALWVSNKVLSDNFICEFEKACSYGVNHIDEAIVNTKKSFSFDISNYLHHSVEYDLTAEKQESIELYLEKGRTLGLL